MKLNQRLFPPHKKTHYCHTYSTAIEISIFALALRTHCLKLSIHSLSTKEGQNTWKSKRKPFLPLTFSVYLCLFCSTHTHFQYMYKSLNHTSDFAQTFRFTFRMVESREALNKKPHKTNDRRNEWFFGALFDICSVFWTIQNR